MFLVSEGGECCFGIFGDVEDGYEGAGERGLGGGVGRTEGQ